MRIAGAVLLFQCLISFPLAAPTSPGSRPAPEHERMSDWLGTWTWTLEIKGSLDPASAPVGTCAGTDTWERFSPFFVIRHVAMTCNGVGGKSLEIMRWEPAKKAYIVADFDDTGVHSEFTITVTGSTWSLTDVGAVGGKKYWHRCAWTFAPSKDSVIQRCDDSTDGKTWTVSAQGQFKK